MNFLIFIFIIIVSFIIVRLGAVAFELTGLEWSLAKFQSISCFTGTGFTTREAELVTGNPQRRRIASALMVFGNAGLVTLIATFANSLRADDIISKLTIPFLDLVVPSKMMPLVNLAIITILVFAIYKFFSYSRFTRKLTDILRARIIKKEIIKRVSFEELVVSTGGYGVSSIDICEKSPVLNKDLIEAKLRDKDITVLAIERNEHVIPNPSANTKMLLHDRIICFGKLENIRKSLCVT